MQPIIGLDFGNFNSFPCFVSGFDIEKSRMGGTVHNLIPAKRDSEGIPSVYFYSKKTGKVLLGYNAVKNDALPLENRLRYLKRYLGKTTTLDGKVISYDQAITEVIQYCIRIANKQLNQEYMSTTNLVSLAYPVSYTHAQKKRLVELVEKATLEDGTPVKVFGTIKEPAAAALDYLADFAHSTKETTVLAYDLGGGTFDLGLVSVYPSGRKTTNGDTYYYDLINNDGIPDLGGHEFTDALYKIMYQKVIKLLGVNSLMPNEEASLWNLAETTKVNLSDLDSNQENAVIYLRGDYLDIPVTRLELENSCKSLVEKTIRKTREMLENHKHQQPDIILLTGGASQMPMIEREMKKAFPQYIDKIKLYRPNYSIAYGAARFGCVEQNTGATPSDGGIINFHLDYDIGIGFFSPLKDTRYVEILLKKGTEIPCKSTLVSSSQRNKGQYTYFPVLEANRANPNAYNVDSDFTEIMHVEIDHGRQVPVGHPHESRLYVDKDNMLHIEARDASKPNLPFKEAKVELKNLSKG